MGLFKKRSFASATAQSRRKPLNQHSGSSSDSGCDSDTEPGRDLVTKRSTVTISNPAKRLKTTDQQDQALKKADFGEVIHNGRSEQISYSDQDDAIDQSKLTDQRKALKTRANDNPELKKGTLEDGLYKGKNQYAEFIPKSKFGPIKASANIRSTFMTDYQPDVCKDYKQTGFCGFGDTCKFLHSREDYKAGWQLDKDWQISKGDQNAKNEDGYNGNADVLKDTEHENLPFACFICKQSFKMPIVTNCGHYFCEVCFLKEFKKKSACYICGKDTNGVFKPARNIIKLMKGK